METNLPQAHQELTPLDKTIRYVICPKHKTRTSHFLGVTQEGWAFRCLKTDHRIIALPDPSAPKDYKDVAKWLQARREARLAALEGKNKGA